MNYYAGIGSRETPVLVMASMEKIGQLLDKYGYCLRSGGANGADTAFAQLVTNKHIYIPYIGFNGLYPNKDNIFIDKDHPMYESAFESLKFHPHGFKLSLKSRNMMIRNYFQIYGQENVLSDFVICWTPGGADGYTRKTDWIDGGTGQAIRLSSANNIPVYNLNDPLYENMDPEKLVELILSNLESKFHPNKISNEFYQLF